MIKHRVQVALSLAASVAPVVAGLTLAAPAYAAPSSAAYKLVFADEFNGTTLDTMKWNYNYSWGPTHNHAAYMTPAQVKIGGGILNLQAIAQRNPNATDHWTNDFGWQVMDYTSGAINTSGKFHADHGYVEARIKMSNVVGSWPAFWMLKDGWPPEIDVMEFPRGTSNSNTQYWTNYHYTDAANAHRSYGWHDNAPDLTAGYHNFAVEWSATSMTFLLDGVARHTINDAAAVADAASMYMILNHAVGGWAGAPNKASFPADYLVDWVRVWQKPASTTTTTDWANTTGAGTWDAAGNWTVQVPKYQDHVARFGSNTTSPSVTVTWSNSRTVGGLIFDTTRAYTLGSTAGSLQFSRTSGPATIDVTAATTTQQRINARMELYNDLRVTNHSASTITLGGSIVGTGALLKAGAGVLALSGTNSFTGGVSFAGGTNSGDLGTIRLLGSGALGSGVVSLPGTNNASQVVELTSFIAIPNDLTTAGRASPVFLRNASGNNAWNGDLTITGTGGGYAIDAAAGNLTLGGTLTTTLAGVSDRVFTLRGAAAGLVSGTVLDGATVNVGIAKADAGTWTLANANHYSGGTTVSAGRLVTRHASALGRGGVTLTGGTLELGAGLPTAVSVPTLAITSPATLELHDNGLIIDHAAGAGPGVLANIRAALAAGSITSDLTASDPRLAIGYADPLAIGLASFRGVALDGHSVVIEAALRGDANLDDTVDFADLLTLAQNYGTSGLVWTSGDSTYDGAADFADLLALAQNYGGTAASVTDFAGAPASFAGDWALAQSLVPEPATLAALALPAVALRRRRHPSLPTSGRGGESAISRR